MLKYLIVAVLIYAIFRFTKSSKIEAPPQDQSNSNKDEYVDYEEIE